MWAMLKVLALSFLCFTYINCTDVEEQDFLSAIGAHEKSSMFKKPVEQQEEQESGPVEPEQTPEPLEQKSLASLAPTSPKIVAPAPTAVSMPKTTGAITTAAKTPKIEPEPEAMQAPKQIEPKIIPPKEPIATTAAPKEVMPEPKKVALPAPEAKVVAPKVVHSVQPEKVVEHPEHETVKKDTDVVLQVEAHTSGLDTINIDSGGNWLEKRIWFKKAEILFGQIRQAVQKAEDTRVEFIQQVHSVGQNMDEFYENVNYEKGQVDEMLKAILDEIAQASQKRGGDLSDKERNIKETVKIEQKQIEQIGNDLKKVSEFDAQIDKTMMQAFRTIENCRELETKSWNNYKEIGAELDDKKARSLYYEIENAYKNIEQNILYLEHTLLPYLTDKLISMAQDTMDSVKTAMRSLEDKGVHLDKLIEEYTQQDLKLERERELQAEKDAEESWEASEKSKLEEEQKEEEEQIWYNRWLATVTCYGTCVCKVITHYAIQVWNALIEFLPFLQNMGCYIQDALCSIYEWFISLQETGRIAFCAAKSWVCNLIGA